MQQTLGFLFLKNQKRYTHSLYIYSHELTYISATNCFMALGQSSGATKLKFILFSVGVRNQNRLNHPDNFRADEIWGKKWGEKVRGKNEEKKIGCMPPPSYHGKGFDWGLTNASVYFYT